MTPFSEPAPQATAPERKLDQFAPDGKAAGITTQFKPLGLRYSIVIRGDDGQERDVDTTTAAAHTGPARLTVETNQDAYIQIWKTGSASPPLLLYPEKDSGKISQKLTAGQRQSIALPTERDRVTIRLARAPFGPITRQEGALLDRPSPDHLQETVTGSDLTGLHEQATYVVNRDSSSTQLSVSIPAGLPN